MPRKPGFRATRARTGGPGTSIGPRNIMATMATGTISAGPAFTAAATTAAASALAGRRRRSGRSGTAADQAMAEAGARVHPFIGSGGRVALLAMTKLFFAWDKLGRRANYQKSGQTLAPKYF